MASYYQSTTYRRGFYMFDATTFASPLGNAAPSVKISKAGASFIYAGGVVTEVPNFGYYTVALTTTDTDTVGSLGFSISGTGASASLFVDQVLTGVQVATIVQSVKDDLVNQIWATAVRSVTSVSSPVGVASNYDKGNYTLSTAAIDALQTQVVNTIWATAVRTITGGVVTSVSSPVGVASNYDKGNYSLSTTAIEAMGPYLVNAIWATPIRTITGGTVTSVASPVGVGSNYDKTGYTLTQGSYDQLVNQVWATPVRTLTSAGAATVDTTAVIAIASGVWDQQRSTRNASGSFGNLVQTFGVTVATNLDKTGYALTQAANDQIVNAVWATAVRSITGGTVTSVSSPVGVASVYDKDNYTLSTTAVAAVSDGLLDRDMGTGTDSGSTSVRTPRQAFRFLRNKWSISGTTLTVTKEDDSTTSWTSVLATAAAADPVTGSDPAGP